MLRNVRSRVAAPRIARILAVIGTLVAIYLHVLFGMNAGALWRDEVSTLEVATMRTFAEMWANLSFESFPALYLCYSPPLRGRSRFCERRFVARLRHCDRPLRPRRGLA